MASTPDNPDWSLLPHDAAGFFGLEENFDRTGLKRAYNRFLKKFKPEKYPQEFQRIRAAYEELEQELRYSEGGHLPIGMPGVHWTGSTVIHTDAPASPWSPAPGRSDTPASAAAPGPVPLHERLAETSVLELIAELKRQENKSPYDYYCLALLTDSQPDAEPLCFLKAILAALKNHRHDPALLRLAKEALRTDLPAQDLANLLNAFSKVVTGDQFYQLTEPAWDQLLLKASFSEFARILQICEKSQPVHEIYGRTVFYLHILRKSLFRADPDWLKQSWAILEEGDQAIPPHLEMDLEFLRTALAYRRWSPVLRETPTGQALDEVIRDYCQSDDQVAQKKFLNLVLQLSTDPRQLLTDLPVKSNEALETAWNTFLWIQHDMANRLGVEFSDHEFTEADTTQMLRWIRLIESQGVSSPGVVHNNLLSGLAHYSRLLIGFLICSGLCGGVIGWTDNLLLAAVVAIAAGAGLYQFDHKWLIPRLQAWLSKDLNKAAMHLYRKSWRMEAARFCELHRLTVSEMQALLHHCVAAENRFDTFLLQRLGEDYALAFYVCALRFAV